VETLAGVPTTLLGLAAPWRMKASRLPSVRRLLFGGETLYPIRRPRCGRCFPTFILLRRLRQRRCRLLGYASPDCGWNEHRVFGSATLMEIIDEASGELIAEPAGPQVLITI